MIPLGILQQQANAIGGDVTFIASNTATRDIAGAGNVTLTKPTGTQSGDLIVIWLSTRNSYASAPSGGGTWDEIYHFHATGSTIVFPATDNDEFWCWSRVAGGSEPSSYTIAMTDEGTDGQAACIATFRNATRISDSWQNATSATRDIYGRDGDMGVMGGGTVFETPEKTQDPPAGWTMQEDAYSGGSGVAMGFATKPITSDGMIGTHTWDTTYINYNITSGQIISGFSENGTNLISPSRDLTGWTQVGGPVLTYNQNGLTGAANTATLVEDDNVGGYEYILDWYDNTVTQNDTWAVRYFMKKDTDVSSFPEFHLRFNTSASSTIAGDGVAIQVNRNTGAIGRRLLTNAVATYRCFTYPGDSNWWEIWITAYSTSTARRYVGVCIFPGASTTLGGGLNTGATGSVISGNVELLKQRSDMAFNGTNPIYTP